MTLATYYLIFFWGGGTAGGPAVMSFPTREACVAAHETMKQEISRMHARHAICINSETGKMR